MRTILEQAFTEYINHKGEQNGLTGKQTFQLIQQLKPDLENLQRGIDRLIDYETGGK